MVKSLINKSDPGSGASNASTEHPLGLPVPHRLDQGKQCPFSSIKSDAHLFVSCLAVLSHSSLCHLLLQANEEALLGENKDSAPFI